MARENPNKRLLDLLSLFVQEDYGEATAGFHVDKDPIFTPNSYIFSSMLGSVRAQIYDDVAGGLSVQQLCSKAAENHWSFVQDRDVFEDCEFESQHTRDALRVLRNSLDTAEGRAFRGTVGKYIHMQQWAKAIDRLEAWMMEKGLNIYTHTVIGGVGGDAGSSDGADSSAADEVARLYGDT